MYHINHEGKIYPCKAKIKKCPYGETRHAKTKEELYYKIMKLSKDAAPAGDAMKEVANTGRLKSLWTASDAIARHSSPIDVVTATLDFAIEAVKKTTPDKVAKRWTPLMKEGSEAVYDCLKYGLKIPSFVPKEIKEQGTSLFYERLNGSPIEYAGSTRNREGLKTLDDIKKLKGDFESYKNFKKWRLTAENYAGTLNWLEEDFYQFSHDLNTSKMITQPVFYGNLKKAKETIQSMGDYELLSAYDDYLLSDNEILDNIALANDFEYKHRNDLNDSANKKLQEWYDMNRKIVKHWKENTPKRVLLSIEMAKELDKRGIFRQDNALGRVLE